MTDIVAMVVAAGSGSRADMGDGLPKQFRPLAGIPLLAHTLNALLADDRIAAVVPVIGPGQHEHYCGVLPHISSEYVGRLLEPVIGGATRQQSVRNGLEALTDRAPEIVLIHDAARSFVTSDLTGRILSALKTMDGAVPALSLTDTIKLSSDGASITETLDRSTLFSVQTPQGFRFDAILAAHRAAAEAHEGLTDDAHVAEHHGLRVGLVAGDAGNVKVTTKEDVMAAEQRLAPALRFETRVGTGYDVHAFEPGDAVILGGVRIPHVARLNGHSDADAGLHALTDALYGALGAGDIGTHFPPSDPQWKGAASRLFIEHAAGMVRARGGRIVNLDLTLICEAPKIAPHVADMRAAIAGFCGIAVERVAVKATTSEKLGFTGRREGIAAIGTASIELPGTES